MRKLNCSACILAGMFLVFNTLSPVSAAQAEPQASETVTVVLEPVFHQSDARKELALVNEFRTGGDAWYWNEDNSEKIPTGKLPALTYDYALEKVAMQRAAEIAVYYSHTRPDGREPWTAYSDRNYSSSYKAENIAYGQSSYSVVFNAWREENAYYKGQGHRRNMLNSHHTAVGFGCVEYNGILYWTQEFSDSVNSSTETPAADYKGTANIRVTMDNIQDWVLDPSSVQVYNRESGKISSLYTLYAKVNGVGNLKAPDTQSSLSWSSSDSSILSVSGDTYTGQKPGKVQLSAIMPDGRYVFMNVQVLSEYVAAEWIWNENDEAKVILRDKHDPSNSITLTANMRYENHMPTCTKEGKYIAIATVEYDGQTYEDRKEEVIPPMGHDWGEPEYEYDEETNRMKGVAHCRNNPLETNTASVPGRVSDYQDPTCEEDGYKILLFDFPDDLTLFKDQTKRFVLKAPGHSWVNDGYRWSKDYKTCTGIAHCTRCHDKLEVAVNTTYKVTKEATRTEDGWGEYTADFTGKEGPFYTQTKKEIILMDDVWIIDMYRLYNPNSGEHFYTAKAGERDFLKNNGWKYEGIGWYAPDSSNTPVYRLYNKYSGDHHYTMKEKEKDALVKLGWKYEGIGWFSDDHKEVPLYREYNPNMSACNHNYTTKKKEHDWLCANGWNNEGIGWYGMKGD